MSPSFADASREAAGGAAAAWMRVCPGSTLRLSPPQPPPPVVVASRRVIAPPFPILEGRHRQPLPRVPGGLRGALLAGLDGDGDRQEQLEAWLLPWRAGADRSLVVTLQPGTVLVVDVSAWPEPNDPGTDNSVERRRDGTLRRAARVLDLAPGAFTTEASVGAAYDRLERVWNDRQLEDEDPLGELLVRQARKLRSVLEDLGTRPRAVLRTEHRMLKLQDARRIDMKTLRWFSAQPGRNTAERAGARQRVKAPKRYETIATLENRVLRAFASLTVRETRGWLARQKKEGTERAVVEAHQLRASRIEALLRERGVPEAAAPVVPNFPLRFDQRYREIWRAWQELRARNAATELEWMWQDRTFMELLSLRAAMKLQQAVSGRPGGGTLAHGAVLRGNSAPSQGSYLEADGVRCTFGVPIRPDGPIRIVEYSPNDSGGPLGAVATAAIGASAGAVWWNAVHPDAGPGVVGELPWTHGQAWDARLKRWAERVVS